LPRRPALGGLGHLDQGPQRSPRRGLRRGDLLSPLAGVILLASLLGLLVSARSLQIGPAVPVTAVTSVAANALTIAAGVIVFSESFSDEALGIIVRLLAFGLVIAAAALTPPPLEVKTRVIGG